MLALGYLVLMALLVGLTSWRFRRRGWTSVMLPGGYATLLFLVFTVGDLAVVFGDHPNLWPLSLGIDRFVLRTAPLALYVGSLLPFWWAESLALKDVRPRPQEPAGMLGPLLIVVALGSLAVILWRLGVTSLEDYLANNYFYRLNLGSQGLTIFQLALALLPVGVALSVPRRLIDSPAYLAVAGLVAALSLITSPSKAAAVLSLVAFSFATFWRTGEIPRWTRNLKLMIPVIVLGVVLIGVSIAAKTVPTGGAPPQSFESALANGAGRLLGYDFQTYAVITKRTADTGEFWGGRFNQAAVVNLVPRAIWQDKPASPVALFRYLSGFEDDPSGAALMAQGSMYIDFGILGVVIGMTLGGYLLGLAGVALQRNGLSGVGLIGFAALMAAPGFVESGFVGAMPTFVGASVILIGTSAIAVRLRLRSRRASRPAVQSSRP